MSANLFRATSGIIITVLASTAVRAQSGPIAKGSASVREAEAPPPTAEASPLLEAGQLEQLLAPVALYPDALLAQILMAATYPLEVVKARRWLQDPNHAALQADQLASALETEPWDPSVKSLVPFPRILRMMDDQLDWTEQLGNAFLSQKANVMDSSQRLRHQAAAAGTLWSDSQQRVTTEGQGIVIEPANPGVIYLPLYNPAAVYGPWPYPSYPPLDIVPSDDGVGFALPFGRGFGAGIAVVQPLWRWCAFDWGGRRIELDVGKFNSLNRSRQRGSSSWQHDPVRRVGMPNQVLAWRAPTASVPAHVSPLFSRAAIPSPRAAAPTTVLGAARPSFIPTGRGVETRIQPQPGHVARQMMAPPMTPLHFAPPMLPRTVMRSAASLPEAGGRAPHR